MKLTLVTVAEPCPPPVRIGAPWRRHHGPNEDADEYLRRLGEQWALEAPGLDTFVVYDPISAAAGMKDYLAAHPTGLIAVTSHLRDRLPHLVFGSGAADIVHTSTAPVARRSRTSSGGMTPMDAGLLILRVVVGVALVGHRRTSAPQQAHSHPPWNSPLRHGWTPADRLRRPVLLVNPRSSTVERGAGEDVGAAGGR